MGKLPSIARGSCQRWFPFMLREVNELEEVKFHMKLYTGECFWPV